MWLTNLANFSIELSIFLEINENYTGNCGQLFFNLEKLKTHWSIYLNKKNTCSIFFCISCKMQSWWQKSPDVSLLSYIPFMNWKLLKVKPKEMTHNLFALSSGSRSCDFDTELLKYIPRIWHSRICEFIIKFYAL